MSAIPEMLESNFPEDGLRFFHGLANWVENCKGLKPNLIEWKKGQKKLKLLACIKPKQQDQLTVPVDLPENSLYVPSSYSGRHVISQLRHAFCHGNLQYDDKSRQYYIDISNKMPIAGSFSIEAIREFVDIYLEQKT